MKYVGEQCTTMMTTTTSNEQQTADYIICYIPCLQFQIYNRQSAIKLSTNYFVIIYF